MTTVFDQSVALAGTDDGDGNQNLNIRVVLVTASLSAASGNQAQLVLLFGTACPTEVGSLTSVWFGQAGAADPNFAGDQVQVKFGGASTVNGSAAGVVTSDIFTLAQNWDNTKKYTLAFHFALTSAASVSIAPAGGALLFNLAGTDTSSSTNPGAMNGPTGDLVFLEKIFITASGGGGASNVLSKRLILLKMEDQ